MNTGTQARSKEKSTLLTSINFVCESENDKKTKIKIKTNPKMADENKLNYF